MCRILKKNEFSFSYGKEPQILYITIDLYAASLHLLTIAQIFMP